MNNASGTTTINVGSNAPASGGVLNNVQGALTVAGSGGDVLNVDDTGSATGKSGTMTSSAVTGLGLAGISYNGVAALNISLGAFGNTFTLASTNGTTATTLNSGAGSDNVTVQSTSGPATVNTQSGNDTVTVAGTGGVTAINTGAGNDTVNVQGTGAATSVNNTSGVTTINVGSKAPASGGVLNNIQGALTVAGSGSDVLNVDDTGSTGAKTGTLTSSKLSGLGMGANGISYAGVAALNINLGSGGNTFSLVSTSSATATTLNSGAGNDTVNVQGTGGVANVNSGAGVNTVNVGSKAPALGGVLNNIQGTLTVTGGGADTLNVDDTGSSGAKTGTLTSSTITGLGMGSGGINYSGVSGLNLNLGAGKNTLAITSLNAGTVTTVNGGGNAGSTLSITLAALFAGTLNVSGFPVISGISVNGNFAGTLTLGSGTNVVSMTVSGNFTGQLLSAGTVTLLSIGGSSPGLISVAAVGTVTVGQAVGPVALTIREGSVQRQIEVTPVVSGTSPAPVFGLYYQSTVAGMAVPQVAIRVADGTPAAQYNLSLTASNVSGGVVVSHSTSGKYDLTLLYAVASGSNTTGLSGLYNLAIEGDLLATVSSGALAFFGLAGNTNGGVQLPKDNVGAVAIRDLGVERSVNVKTLQALAFGEYQEEEGDINPASNAGSEDAGDLLVSTQEIVAANGTCRVPFGQNYTVALFIGQSNGQFEGNPVLLTDEYTDNTAVIATVKVVAGNPPQVASVGLSGDGGSVQTNQVISQSITSSGPLGDLYLNQNNTALNVTAPGIFGNIDLGGVLSGVIQTTGQRVDPVSGLTTAVPADLGSVASRTAVTTEGTMTGQLIVRGNLVSQINLNNGMSGGVIAVQGNLGAQAGSTRVGGLNFNGGGGFGGKLVVLGNVWGDINFNGGLRSGRVAVSGTVYGNFEVEGGVDAASAIVVRGAVGSTSLGTALYLDSLNGILAVEGSVNSGENTSSSHALFNKTNLGTGNANSSAVDAIFTNGGQTLGLDLAPANLDLQGLGYILTDLAALHVTGGTLAGPIQ